MSELVVAYSSFAGGEISPALWGRTDLAKHKVSAALLRNFLVDFRGPAFNRPGTSFVGIAGFGSSPTRGIRFVFSTGQSYDLIFGNLTLQLVSNGGMVLNATKTVTAMTNANPGVFTSAAHGYTNGTIVTFPTLVGVPQLSIGQFLIAGATTNTFTLTDIFGNAIDTTLFGVFSSGTIASIYTVTSPYAATDLALLKYNQSGDTIFLTHPNYPPYALKRGGATNWTFNQVFFNPSVSPPQPATITPSVAGSTTYVYCITAVGVNGQESFRSPAIFTTSSATMSASGGGHITVTFPPYALGPNSTISVVGYNVYRMPEVPASAPAGNAQFGYVGFVPFTGNNFTNNGVTLTFVDTNINPDFTRSPPVQSQLSPTNYGTINTTGLSTGTGYQVGDQIYVGISAAGFAGQPGWAPSIMQVTSVSAGVITAVTPITPGFLGSGSLYIANDYPCHGTGATFFPTHGSASNNYPSCSAFFQQRLVFGGFSLNPTQLIFSRSGDFYNFTYSTPSQASDSISATIVSREVNIIKHLVPMTSLITLSSDGAWKIDAGQFGGAITPTTLQATPQAYVGASDPTPIVINYDILYVQARGSVVRDLNYNFYVNIYTGNDISMLADHLFYPHTIKEWAWAQEPNRIVWAVRDDGILLSLTYVKEQEVMGWSHNDTQGDYLSVASIPEGNIDAVYFIVGRWLNGKYIQFIERQVPRITGSDPAVGYPGDPSRSWFLDCGLGYNPIPGTANAFPFGTTGTFLIDLDSVISAIVSGVVIRLNGGWFTVNSTSISVPGVAMQLNVTTIIPSVGTEVASPGDWTYSTPVTTVYGLWHLNGLPVSVLADGGVVSGITVTNGQITLPQAASAIVAGLPYQSQFQSLPLNPPGQGTESTQGKRTTFNRTTVRMRDSRAMKVGPDFNSLTQFKEMTPQVYMGNPIGLMTGDESIIPRVQASGFTQICIQQDDPLPCCITGIFPNVEVGDQ